MITFRLTDNGKRTLVYVQASGLIGEIIHCTGELDMSNPQIMSALDMQAIAQYMAGLQLDVEKLNRQLSQWFEHAISVEQRQSYLNFLAFRIDKPMSVDDQNSSMLWWLRRQCRAAEYIRFRDSIEKEKS